MSRYRLNMDTREWEPAEARPDVKRRPPIHMKAGPFVSYAMDPKDAAAVGHTTRDRHGNVAFESQRQANEVIARTHDTNNPMINVR